MEANLMLMLHNVSILLVSRSRPDDSLYSSLVFLIFFSNRKYFTVGSLVDQIITIYQKKICQSFGFVHQLSNGSRRQRKKDEWGEEERGRKEGKREIGKEVDSQFVSKK